MNSDNMIHVKGHRYDWKLKFFGILLLNSLTFIEILFFTTSIFSRLSFGRLVFTLHFQSLIFTYCLLMSYFCLSFLPPPLRSFFS